MPKLFDRVKVNIATTGTGTVTFGPASSPAFLTPSEAGAMDGNTVRYVIVDGTDFEEGVGTILATVAQMSRDTVTRSKIGGGLGSAKIALSGTAVLVFTASAADILNPANNFSDLPNAAAGRGNLGLGTANNPHFNSLELGHATDTTVSRPAAGRMQIEGEEVLTTRDLSSTLSGPQKAALQTNIGATTIGQALLTAASYVDVVRQVAFSPVLVKSANATVVANDKGATILVDASGGAKTMSLQPMVGAAGQEFTFKKIDTTTNAVVVDGDSTDPVEDTLTYSLRQFGESVTFVSSGSGWVIKSDSPGRYRRGFVKMWARLTYSSGTPIASDSFNVSSMTDQAVGDARFNLAIPFANTSYAPVVGSMNTSNRSSGNIASASQVGIYSLDNAGGSLVDSTATIAAWGDQ